MRINLSGFQFEGTRADYDYFVDSIPKLKDAMHQYQMDINDTTVDYQTRLKNIDAKNGKGAGFT